MLRVSRGLQSEHACPEDTMLNLGLGAHFMGLALKTPRNCFPPSSATAGLIMDNTREVDVHRCVAHIGEA